MNMSALRRSPWILPALLSVNVLFALIAALAADGIWDVLSWLLLLLPILVIGWAFAKKRQ